MDTVYDMLDEYEEEIKDLKKQVTNLRVKVGS
jgi:ribosomal protein L29